MWSDVSVMLTQSLALWSAWASSRSLSLGLFALGDVGLGGSTASAAAAAGW